MANSSSQRTRVLFVCMGNICRSPAAEAIFRDRVNKAGLQEQVECDSAGTIGYHIGERADRRMRAAAARRGYSLESLSRQVQPKDFEQFDHIIAMDEENMEVLESIQRRHPGKARLSLMLEHGNRNSETEVPDPYYGGDRGFEHVLDLLEDACSGLLESVASDRKG